MGEFSALSPATLVTCSLDKKPFEGLRRMKEAGSISNPDITKPSTGQFDGLAKSLGRRIADYNSVAVRSNGADPKHRRPACDSSSPATIARTTNSRRAEPSPLKSNQKCVSAETGANSNEEPFLTSGAPASARYRRYGAGWHGAPSTLHASRSRTQASAEARFRAC